VLEFKPDVDNRQTRRAPKEIPPGIGNMLERTYRDTTVAELPCDSDEDSAAFLRMCRLYATRKNMKVHHEVFEKNGQTYIRVKMREKRQYRKTSPVWQQAS
jgi:hypothetical protein